MDADEEWLADEARRSEAVDTVVRFAPALPSRFADGVDGPGYFAWVIERCLEWYDAGRDLAATQLFFYLLHKHPFTTQMLAQNNMSVVSVASGLGREAFEESMRRFAPNS